MIKKTLSRVDTQIAMNDWLAAYPALPKVDSDYMTVRQELQDLEAQVRKEAEGKNKIDYYIDVHFGLYLYDYLRKKPGFTMRAAANDDFWRYLSLKVVRIWLQTGGEKIMSRITGVNPREFGCAVSGGMCIYPGRAILNGQHRYWMRHAFLPTVF